MALLKQGSKHTDVARLQKFLGVDTTGYFGALTRAAVEAFQVKHGIAKKGDEGFGLVGPKTRTKLNELFTDAGSGALQAGVASPTASSQGEVQSGNAAVSVGTTFVRALRMGAKGEDVKLLQVVLNTDVDTRVAASGDGSSGKETTMLGRLTLAAIGRFQVKHGIAKPGEEGYGNVGPKTRAKLNVVLAAYLAATTAPAPAPTPTPSATPEAAASTASTGSPQASSPQTSSGQATTTASASTTVEVMASTTVSATTTTP